MGILENLKEILQVLMHSHRVIAQVAFRANKNLKASPACGYREDSGSLRMAGARRVNHASLVVLACDPCESRVVLPFLHHRGCSLHLQICWKCTCLINGVNALCFWLMGHQSHSCWAVIDFPTLLLQLYHRCSLSEVRRRCCKPWRRP